jgi:antitoxin component YwqK of YwqJK toxin-antitoxin module
MLSNLLNMRWILALAFFFSINGNGQLKSYIIGVKGDTLNRVDAGGKKQGKWVVRYDELRGEPGFEEEGMYDNDRKEGPWRKYTLSGDLFGVENYRWGFKDGISRYFNINGDLLREESWRAFNPDKLYDTIDVEDVNNPDHFNKVVIKNEGSSLKHGTWRYYDPSTGFINKTEFYLYGKLEEGKNAAVKKTAVDSAATANKARAKPKEVMDFEKKNSGKKKVRVRDGKTF